MHEVAPGRYFGTGAIGAAGPWRMTAVIGRGDDRLSIPLDWSVAPPAQPRLVPRPGARLAPIVDAAACLVAIAVAAALVVRRRRRAPRPRALTALGPPAVEERIPEVVS
jgi:hypothetical protein